MQLTRNRHHEHSRAGGSCDNRRSRAIGCPPLGSSPSATHINGCWQIVTSPPPSKIGRRCLVCFVNFDFFFFCPTVFQHNPPYFSARVGSKSNDERRQLTEWLATIAENLLYFGTSLFCKLTAEFFSCLLFFLSVAENIKAYRLSANVQSDYLINNRRYSQGARWWLLLSVFNLDCCVCVCVFF